MISKWNKVLRIKVLDLIKLKVQRLNLFLLKTEPKDIWWFSDSLQLVRTIYPDSFSHNSIFFFLVRVGWGDFKLVDEDTAG